MNKGRRSFISTMFMGVMLACSMSFASAAVSDTVAVMEYQAVATPDKTYSLEGVAIAGEVISVKGGDSVSGGAKAAVPAYTLAADSNVKNAVFKKVGAQGVADRRSRGITRL